MARTSILRRATKELRRVQRYVKSFDKSWSPSRVVSEFALLGYNPIDSGISFRTLVKPKVPFVVKVQYSGLGYSVPRKTSRAARYYLYPIWEFIMPFGRIIVQRKVRMEFRRYHESPKALEVLKKKKLYWPDSHAGNCGWLGKKAVFFDY